MTDPPPCSSAMDAPWTAVMTKDLGGYCGMGSGQQIQVHFAGGLQARPGRLS